MPNPLLYQITDAQGRVIVAYVRFQVATDFLQYLQVNDARTGANAVTLSQMPGQ